MATSCTSHRQTRSQLPAVDVVAEILAVHLAYVVGRLPSRFSRVLYKRASQQLSSELFVASLTSPIVRIDIIVQVHVHGVVSVSDERHAVVGGVVVVFLSDLRCETLQKLTILSLADVGRQQCVHASEKFRLPKGAN